MACRESYAIPFRRYSAGDPKEEELRGERSFAKICFYESVKYSPENIGRLLQ